MFSANYVVILFLTFEQENHSVSNTLLPLSNVTQSWTHCKNTKSCCVQSKQSYSACNNLTLKQEAVFYFPFKLALKGFIGICYCLSIKSYEKNFKRK